MERDNGLSVAEAAVRLGVTKEAVRRRIDRKSLRATKGTDGAWRVSLDADTPPRVVRIPPRP